MPNSSYRLPNGVTPIQGNGKVGVNIWFPPPSTPQLNVGPGTPIYAATDAVGWLDQPNEPIEVSAQLWRFPKEIPDLFAQMLADWDGKTSLIQEVQLDDLNHISMTGNYMKNTDTSKYHMKSAIPLDMEFHTNMAGTRRKPVPPQDHVRVAAVRFLRGEGRGTESKWRMSAFIDRPGDFFEPITVPEFSPENDIVMLLPEDHDRDGIKATFFDFHIILPAK